MNNHNPGFITHPRGPALWLLACLALLALAAAGTARGAVTTSFDHFTTGFPLTGAHTRVDCENCHVGGVFRNTPTQCAACHTHGGRIGASAKPVDHMPSTDACAYCHTTRAWRPVARVDHTAVIGTCVRCHNGTLAPGKPPHHIASNNNCDDCHTTSNWQGAVFDHSGVAAGHLRHLSQRQQGHRQAGDAHQTTNTCDACHSTRAGIR